MAVTDVIIDEVVATVRTMDSAQLLDPKLVGTLVSAVLDGSDQRKARERRRRDDARIGDEDQRDRREDW